jgi:hypothetical protein
MSFNILHSPILKTIGVSVAGLVAPAVLAAVDHPAGGLGQALATHPVYAETYGIFALLLHNIWSGFQAQDLASVTTPAAEAKTTPPVK